MQINLNEKAELKLNSHFNLISELDNKDEIIGNVISKLINRLPDSSITYELHNELPIDVLILEAIKDQRKAKKIKEVLGLFSKRKQKRKLNKPVTQDSTQ